jgi:hypothetical protein
MLLVIIFELRILCYPTNRTGGVGEPCRRVQAD